MDYVQYVDGDECYDGMDVGAFPSLESLTLFGLPNLERLLEIETGDMFPRPSNLHVSNCPKLRLSLLPCPKVLRTRECNNEFLKSISSLNSLDSLYVEFSEDFTSFPEGMMNSLTCLKTLQISNCPKLKEVPYEITKLNTLESLNINSCGELVLFPDQVLEGLRFLQTLEIGWCKGLRSLPDGEQHLTSLEALTIDHCPALKKRCKKGTGEDWHKIEHIPNVTLAGSDDGEIHTRNVIAD